MAHIICDEHGGKPAKQVCPHLFNNVIDKQQPETVIRLEAKYLGEPAWWIYLCSQCAMQQGYSESAIVPGDDALDKLMAMDQSPVCSMCFDECCREL